MALDIRRDRYWQLDTEAGALLAMVEGADSAGVSDQRLEPLVELGLVAAGPRTAERAVLPAPQRSLHDEVGLRSGGAWRDIMEVALLLAMARTHLRLMCLQRVLATFQRPPELDEDAIGALGQLVRRFERARALVPFAPRCLPDTIAWLKFIKRRGHGANLVFGVVSSPFQAHCWAQVGDIVHNDALDHARRFSPILVV